MGRWEPDQQICNERHCLMHEEMEYARWHEEFKAFKN
jgi:hypothetical protein